MSPATAGPGSSPARGRASSATSLRGAAATAHPLATAAAVHVLDQGGSAVDAAIAAQAVIAVVLPQAAGLGGDMLALVHSDGLTGAVNGTGASPRGMSAAPASTGPTSITVPGLVDGWLTLHRAWGVLALDEVLTAAIALADDGIVPGVDLLDAVRVQRARLDVGGADAWSLLGAADAGGVGSWRQPELATLLRAIVRHGRDAFYTGPAAQAMVAAVVRGGGWLGADDLADHRTPCPEPVAVAWGEHRLHVQPPQSQGVLLAMAAAKLRQLAGQGVSLDDHVLIEVTQAAFAHRSSCGRGAALLDEELEVDLVRASGRGGPRGYLHTAGVACADRSGQVVSSLVSVFDDFGSAVYVPELGFVLNNRAAGFTDGDNAAAPGKRPVHTLAPALLTGPTGTLAIATPGADGQVQTLLQVLTATLEHGVPLADAVSALRWRSQSGEVLVEQGHPAGEELTARGHRVVDTAVGADLFGAVVAAGTAPEPFAVADWRRQTNAAGVP